MSNIESCSMCCLFKLTEHSQPVPSLTFSPNREYLMSDSDDNTIEVWKVSSGERIKTLTDSSQYFKNVVFSPDGEYLAHESWDYTIGMYSVSSGERINTLTGH